MTYWTVHVISDYLDQCQVEYHYSPGEVFFISWFDHYCWVSWRNEDSNRIACRPFDEDLVRGTQSPERVSYVEAAELTAASFRELLIHVLDADWLATQNQFREKIVMDLTPEK